MGRLVVRLGVGVVYASVFSLAECFLELGGQVSAETILEGPHALAVGDANPIPIVQYQTQVSLQARQRCQVAVHKRDPPLLGGNSQLASIA